MSTRRTTRWSEATQLPGGVYADWRPGEDPEAVGVEVLFVAEDGAGYVVFSGCALIGLGAYFRSPARRSR